MKFNKLLFSLVVAFSILFLIGCGSDNNTDNGTANDSDNGSSEKVNDSEETNNAEETNDTDETNDSEDTNNSEGTSSLEADQDLTEKIEAVEGVESAMVQLEDGETDYVNVDIVISDNQDPDKGDLVNKFEEIIKAEYPDRVIDMIIIKGEEVVEQTTIE